MPRREIYWRVFRVDPIYSEPKWYFSLIAKNGEILLQSEGYTRKIDALATVDTVKEFAANAPVRVSKGTK